MVKIPSFLLPLLLISIHGCGAGNSVKNTDNAQSGIGQNVKEAKQTKVAEPGSSTRSISLDDLLGNSSSNSGLEVVSNSGSWKYYTGPDGTSRQDLSGVEWVVLEGGQGKLLTQAMVSRELRRYVIKGSFDLGGKTIRMPYGSVLDLESGDLRNGSIVFDDTRVTPVYAISKQTKVSKVKVSGTYYETLVDLWGASAEPVFPWDTTPPKRVYTVDLKKFGITAGYQKKGSNGHYSDKQYDLMYNNGVGFTNAIQWAYKNGYDGIRFPKNDYCFTPRTVGSNNSPLCAQVLIQDLEKFDIDLGGGSYYNILDSSRMSKYYKDGTEAFNQQSYMFWFSCCANITIRNGVLVGDRRIRDYSNTSEKKQEGTYGIALSAYCYSFRIIDIDVSGFMGDGITMSQTGNYFNSYDEPAKSPSHTFDNDVLVKPSSFTSYNGKDAVVTDYIDLSRLYAASEFHVLADKLKKRGLYTINNNRGYTSVPNIYLNLEVTTYKAKSGVAVRKINSSYLESIRLEPNEKYIRLSFFYDKKTQDSYSHSVWITDQVSSDVIIRNCKVHDNHRGGISGGMNNTLITNCSFSKNSSETNINGVTIPIYSVGATNYHIDYEGSFCKALFISNNRFQSDDKMVGRLFFRVLTLDFYDNYLDSSLGVYNNIFADIHNNELYNGGLWLSAWLLSNKQENRELYGCKYLSRIITFHDNTVRGEYPQWNDYRTFVYAFSNKKL